MVRTSPRASLDFFRGKYLGKYLARRGLTSA